MKRPVTPRAARGRNKQNRLRFIRDQLWRRWKMSSRSAAARVPRRYMARSTIPKFLKSFATDFDNAAGSPGSRLQDYLQIKGPIHSSWMGPFKIEVVAL